MKQYNELQAARKEKPKEEQRSLKVLVKLARVASGAVVRWHRAIKDNNQQSERRPGPEEQREATPKYRSRMLACTRCNQQQETTWKLRTAQGFRAVHCRGCGNQERSARNKCQCGKIWHQCLVHRVDPLQHHSRKAAKFTPTQLQENLNKRRKTEQQSGLRNKRKAPEIQEDAP